MVTLLLLRLFAVGLLVALNAFFVAAEFALVNVRDTRLQEMIAAGRHGAVTVRKLHQNIDEVLNACQFGITIASLALGWIGEPALAGLMLPLFEHVPHGQYYAHGVAIVIAFAVITYLHVILGEVVPKSLALQRAEQMALAVARPMDITMLVFRPFLTVMNSSASAVLRLFGSRRIGEGGVHSPEEIKLVATASRRFGLLPALQEDIIHRAIELNEVTVREIMVPRHRIFSLPADLTLEEAMHKVIEDQHSRIPVYDPEDGPDRIVGVLYSKDLTRFLHTREDPADSLFGVSHRLTLRVRHIMRELLVVPETKPVADLLEELKRRRRHIAVVVDEFGSTSGLVTVEDALEQLVGEIEDEFDIEEPAIAITGGPMVLDGSENIRDLETRFRIMLPRDNGFETLGGFVLARLQKIPALNDAFEFDGRRYTVEAMDGRRVGRVRIEQVQVPVEHAAEVSDEVPE